MILPCPRCPKTAKNHLVAKRHRDSQHSSQMTSKSVPFWSQNGSKIGPKMVSERVLNLLLFLGCFLGPNWTQKWSQKGSKIGPKMGSAAQMCSWSPKWAPKWTQNGSGVPKWTQNGSFGLLFGPNLDPKMVPKRFQNWSHNGVSRPDVLRRSMARARPRRNARSVNN